MKQILLLIFISQLSFSGDFEKTKTVMFANHISTKRGKSSIKIHYENCKTYERNSFEIKNKHISEQELKSEVFWITHSNGGKSTSKKHRLSDKTGYHIFTDADDAFFVSTAPIQKFYRSLNKK